MGEIEPVDLDEELKFERKAPVVIDVKTLDVETGETTIAVRFSASHEATHRGDMNFETWIWVAGRPTEYREGGKVNAITDVMNGTTRLREASSRPETLGMLMIESWLINHEYDWALASTEGERDLNDRRLSADGQTVEEIEEQQVPEYCPGLDDPRCKGICTVTHQGPMPEGVGPKGAKIKDPDCFR